MRLIVVAAAAAMTASLLTLAAHNASAAPAFSILAAPQGAAQTVQYWDQRPYDDRWERRQQWREWRRDRDEARIAEAARREAWRIEQERDQRRAWQHQQGYGPRYERGW